MTTSTRRFATRALRAVPAFVRAYDAATDVKQAAREGASDAAYAARRKVRRARQAAEDTVDDTRTLIRHNPLRSVAIAALVGSFTGALAAWLTGRPRRERADI